jgi:predicted nucleotidyltransferase component of viral defense system
VLPPETERLWGFLKEQPTLAGFVLVGGTALALQIKHRRSEDLDLAWLETRLPRPQLEAFRMVACESGFNFQHDDDEAALLEFEKGGMELRDYQQNFLVNNTVRVSFFVPDNATSKVLDQQPATKPRVATLRELFKTKCLVSAVRSKTRDWLDLYVLLREHGFSIRDFQAAFREADAESQCPTALTRLCSGVPQRDDEGYAHLLAQPPTLAEMKDFFVAQRNLLEVDSAGEALRKRNPNHGHT